MIDSSNQTSESSPADLTRASKGTNRRQADSAHPAPSSEHEQKLIISREGEIIREYEVGSREVTLGRKTSNDIQLNDMAVSGTHARISNISGYIFIEDLGSTNGTTVNGKHIKKVALEHGDIVQIGHYQITYLSEFIAKYEPTMFVRAEHDETQIIYVDSEGPGNPADRYQLGGLKVHKSDDDKPVMELRKTYNTIGFKNKGMALIKRGPSHYTIHAILDSQSRRAEDIPLLNGHPISHEETKLTPGDIITIAGFNLEFYFLS